MCELYLLHGRMAPDDNPDGWGFDGPRLQGVKGLHFTYMTHHNVHFVDKSAAETAHELTGWPYFGDDALSMQFHDDLVMINPAGGVKQYFGDWGTMEPAAEQKRGR